MEAMKESCASMIVMAGYDDGWRASFIRSNVDVSCADCMMIQRLLVEVS